MFRPFIPHPLTWYWQLNNCIRYQSRGFWSIRGIESGSHSPWKLRCFIISDGYVPITCRVTIHSPSNNLPHGVSSLHSFGPTCTSQGHLTMWVPGSKFSWATSRTLHIVPTWDFNRISFPLIWILYGGPQVVCNMQGTGSAISESFIHVSQHFVQSLSPLLQGLRIGLLSGP